MRHPWCSLLLLLLLVFAQEGALVHEIGHQRAPVSSSRHSTPEHTGDRVCSLCLAFAQLAGIAHGGPLPLPAAALQHALHQSSDVPAASSPAILCRNRGPPAAPA